MIRTTVAADTAALMQIIENSGQFDTESLEHVKGTLLQYLSGESTDIWLTADDGQPVGVAYCASEAVTNGTWNLLMLWTRKDKSGQGYGKKLLSHVENELTSRSVRLLIVETSGLPEFEVARSFYSKCGFEQEARVRNFFADGDDKLIYTKTLTS